MMQLFKRFSSDQLLLSLIILCSGIISLSTLTKGMLFIGDQAWFYLSARDLLLMKSFPLVGITSSHTWLHQGPLWTYLLALALWIGRFNPISGAYLSVGIGMLTILSMYLLGKRMFSKEIALLAATLYAFSPLIIQGLRMPYHTTPIPLFTLLFFFSLSQWIKGKITYLPLAVFVLAILYNFELAAVMLFGPLVILLFYGYWKNEDWVKKFTKKDFLNTIFLGIIPMVPIIIYDFSHGFKQTIVYAGWLVFNTFRSFLSLFTHATSTGSITDTLYFLFQRIGQLIFLPNNVIALFVFVLSLVLLVRLGMNDFRLKRQISPQILLLLWVFFTFGAVIANKTPSDAYLPFLYPAVFLTLAVTLDSLPKYLLKGALVLLGLGVLLNVSLLLKHNYFMTSSEGLTIKNTKEAVQVMIAEAKGEPFQIKGRGPGSQFRSFTMPYEYLAWYNHHPATQQAKTEFIIQEEGDMIILTQTR